MPLSLIICFYWLKSLIRSSIQGVFHFSFHWKKIQFIPYLETSHWLSSEKAKHVFAVCYIRCQIWHHIACSKVITNVDKYDDWCNESKLVTPPLFLFNKVVDIYRRGQAEKLKIFGTHPSWAVSCLAYTKFHLPRPVFHSPNQIFTHNGERVSASWITLKVLSFQPNVSFPQIMLWISVYGWRHTHPAIITRITVKSLI